MNHTDDPTDAKTLALLKKVIACLVDDIDHVTIENEMRDGSVYFGVFASPRDVRFLIGKDGRMADAIRAILKGIGKQSHRSYQVFFEPNVSYQSPNSLSQKSSQD